MQIPSVTEFDKPTGCSELKEFICFDKRESLRDASMGEKKGKGPTSGEPSYVDDDTVSDASFSPSSTESKSKRSATTTSQRFSRTRTLRRKSHTEGPLAITK